MPSLAIRGSEQRQKKYEYIVIYIYVQSEFGFLGSGPFGARVAVTLATLAVLKVPLELPFAVGVGPLPLAVLEAVLPLARVDAAVGEEHGAPTVFHALVPLARVGVAVSVQVLAVAVAFVAVVRPLVDFAVGKR